ncbi:tRNA lysidine(34) synthetase TilS [Salinicola avicenniae]|uniref:tRNA lysidine(34) synthetase TilS n=1 Tax=Salinicola avicenniae TaxID=2916836 RepID=UPI0020737A1A|nr:MULTISPECIES: tRNA lysidine(34) synthetase TilS [unclassified Salinicola]
MTPNRLVDDALAQCAPGRRVWVALSGGLDSSLLLHVTAPLAHARGLSLRAIHINHGLQATAVDFETHCRDLCDRLAVPLTVVPVEVVPDGVGIEAAAREARYRAFRQHLAAGDLLLLAQHADDQAETFLLAALRGSGVRGLAAMPPLRQEAGIVIARPWLSLSRAALVEEASQRKVSWVEDPTNGDDGYDRNYLRLRVLPALAERWPQGARALARSADWLQEADDLLGELAAQDLSAAGGEPARLAITALRPLRESRRRLLIRHALERLGVPPIPRSRLAELDRQLLGAGEDRQVCVDWRGGEARLWRETLYLMAPLAPVAPDWQREWDGRASLETPWGVHRIALMPLEDRDVVASFRVTVRRGGECLRLEGRGRRDLKRLLQQAGVPPWQRERLPLIWHGDALIAVPGVATAAGWRLTRAQAS